MVGDPADKPAFLDPNRAASIGYVGADDVPSFDTELVERPELGEDLEPRGKGPSRGYEVRHSEIARLHALGYTNNQIARHLGYSAPGISLALQKPYVQSEVERWRTHYFSQDTANLVKDAALDGMKRIHKIILNPETKEGTALAASQWAVEKATGKAKQEVAVGSGDLSTFMDLLKEVRNTGQPLETPVREVREIQGSDAPQAGQWSTWITENI